MGRTSDAALIHELDTRISARIDALEVRVTALEAKDAELAARIEEVALTIPVLSGGDVGTEFTSSEPNAAPSWNIPQGGFTASATANFDLWASGYLQDPDGPDIPPTVTVTSGYTLPTGWSLTGTSGTVLTYDDTATSSSTVTVRLTANDGINIVDSPEFTITTNEQAPGPIPTTGPALFFTDLTAGPNTGNGDTSKGLGAGVNGAIVTVWGKGLGSSQGTSTITVGGVAASAIYYWGAASPPWSPANLANQYQNMQCVIFQVASGTATGAQNIVVTVGGVASNAISFRVLTYNTESRIFFCAPSGSDANPGTYASPRLTIPSLLNLMNQPGDIGYVMNGVNQQGLDGTAHLSFDVAHGTAERPIQLTTYPGSTSMIGAYGTTAVTFRTTGGSFPGEARYNTISKFRIRGLHVGVLVKKTNSVRGCQIEAEFGDLDAGAISSSEATGDNYLIGNELTKVGKQNMTNGSLYHVIYISGRRALTAGQEVTLANYHIAYNYIHDNYCARGINIFSMVQGGATSDHISDLHIHHNCIVDQYGDGILLGNFVINTNYVYENLLIRCGKGPISDASQSTTHAGIHFAMGGISYLPSATATAHVYHNTFIDCGATNLAGKFVGVYPNTSGSTAYPTNVTGCIHVPDATNKNQFVRLHNNIFWQNNAQPYLTVASGTAPTQNSTNYSRNLWYGAGTAPTWDTNPTNNSPLLEDSTTPQPYLRAWSAAVGYGNTSLPATPPNDWWDWDGRAISSRYDLGCAQLNKPQPAWTSGATTNVPKRISNTSFISAAVQNQYVGLTQGALPRLGHPEFSYIAGTRDGFTSANDLNASLHYTGPKLWARTAYSGSPFDPETDSFFLHGGGHAAGTSNEVLKIDMSQGAPSWSVFKQPSYPKDMKSCFETSHTDHYAQNPYYTSGTFLDGAPQVGHQMTRVFYLRSDNALWKFHSGVGFTGGGGSGDDGIYSLDLTTKEWTKHGTTQQIGISQDYRDMMIVDYRNDNVYFIKYSGQIYRWAGPSNPLSFTALTTISSPRTFFIWPSCIDTRRNKLVFATAGVDASTQTGTQGFVDMDLPNCTNVRYRAVGNATTDDIFTSGKSLEYDPDGDTYVYVDLQGGAGPLMYKFNPDTANKTGFAWLNTGDTWTVETPIDWASWSLNRVRYSRRTKGLLMAAPAMGGTPRDNSCSVYYVKLH